MSEGIRLVIWDLDETFWKGTLTEGGHVYQEESHHIVVELARRGIMSSICSKNDRETVETILRAADIWDYFIFPSIDWNAKGPRIRDMVETIGLRPSTVMFIDDNPMNLNEALHFVPELKVARETFIPEILNNSLFLGREDLRLARLAQYKVLERRRSDEQAAGIDNTDFLRSSGLRVTINHDIEPNIDRVIELINRTNQLNFTKKRVSEDPVVARNEIVETFSGFMIQGGLVHVEDNYGDYGFCGFYAINVLAHEMVHYCFSCRILGMGVERWLYDRLGRPSLNTIGEVVTDLSATSRPIDWINDEGKEGVGNLGAGRRFRKVRLRGGCELQILSHYLSLAVGDVDGDFFTIRNGLPLRLDHSIFSRSILKPTDPAKVAALAPLGYVQDDFSSKLIEDSNDAEFYVLSFWQDASHTLYRHRSLEIEIPFEVPNVDNALSAFDLPPRILAEALPDPFGREAVEYLRRNFECIGVSSSETFLKNVSGLVDLIPATRMIFILLQLENWPNPATKEMEPIPHHIWSNDVMRSLAALKSNVYLIPIEEFIEADAEIIDGVHFVRLVYYRIVQYILRRASPIRELSFEPPT